MNMRFFRRGARLVPAAAMLAWLTACSPHGTTGTGDDHAGHDHGDEPPAAQATVYADGYEIFVEYPLPVAGTPTRFLTHVTDSETFEPRRDGELRLIARLGQESPIEHLQRAPSRPGIYEPALTFPKPGDWSVQVVLPVEGGERKLSLPPVKVYADAHDAVHGETAPVPEGVTFLKEQQWSLHMTTAPAGKRRLIEQLRLPGSVSARPGSLAHVTPPVAGRFSLPAGKTMPLVGDAVQAGQVLTLVQPSFSDLAARFLEAEAEAARSKLALEQADLVLQRIQKLAQAEAKSGRELQEAEFALKTARAKYEAALAARSVYRQAAPNPDDTGTIRTNPPSVELRAPIAGTIVAQSGAALGEHIVAEKPVFTILDSATVFLQAPVPENSVSRLGAARSARYELPGQTGRFYPVTGEGAGRLVYLGHQVDPATRTVPLVYETRNPDGRLRVGQSLNVYVETSREEQALTVPEDALVEEGGRPVAYVQVAGERFQKREVTLGIRDGAWVQVLSGIAEGERVVTRGAFAIRLASISSALPSDGHAH